MPADPSPRESDLGTHWLDGSLLATEASVRSVGAWLTCYTGVCKPIEKFQHESAQTGTRTSGCIADVRFQGLCRRCGFC